MTWISFVHFLGAFTVIVFYLCLGLLPIVFICLLAVCLTKFFQKQKETNFLKSVEESSDTFALYSMTTQDRIKREKLLARRVYSVLRSIPGVKQVLADVCFTVAGESIRFPFVMVHETGIYAFVLFDSKNIIENSSTHQLLFNGLTIKNPFLLMPQFLLQLENKYSVASHVFGVCPSSCEILGEVSKEIVSEDDLYTILCKTILKSSEALDRKQIDKIVQDFSKEISDALDFQEGILKKENICL